MTSIGMALSSKRLVCLSCLLFVIMQLWALDTSETRTINVTTAGKLPSLLPQNERGYVVNLTLTGKLNGTDFNVLRSMATDQKLQILDLSGANIVSGGASYYTNYGTDYYTKDNEFGYALFDGCKKIQKVVLPNSLQTIGQCSFWYCSNLKTLVIGAKVTKIYPGLWGGCSSLTDVQLNSNSNFHLTNGILYNKDYTTIIAALLTWNHGDLIIRSGVKEIQYEAFSFCSQLTSVTFPSSVTTIGTTAFEYTGITSVKFTSAITSIGSFAFSGCKSLKELDLTSLKLTSLDYGLFMTSNVEIVYLPKTLKELKQAVFSNTPLKHVFSYTSTPATMYDLSTSSPTFKGVDTNSCIVHVPQGKVNTYKAATGWKDFLYITDSQEIEPDKPKTISNFDDLQARLDEIAAKGLSHSNFETVELAEEGVLVDKPLYVRNGCQAMLTGGPLYISPNISSHYCISIDNKSFLYLSKMTVDMMNNDFHINSAIFYSMGELRIGNTVYDWDVKFTNVPTSKGSYGECLFYIGAGSTLYYDNPGNLYSGNLSVFKAGEMATLNIWTSEIESTGVPTIDGSGRVSLSSTVIGSGTGISIIKAKEFWSLEALQTINDRNGGATYISADKIYFSFQNGTFSGNGKNIEIGEYATISTKSPIPTLFLKKDAYISMVGGQMQTEWTLDADWISFTLEKVVIENVESANDLAKISFLNMPSDREAYYDETNKAIKLRKKTEACDVDEMEIILNNYAQSGNTGTTDAPAVITPCDEPTIDEDLDVDEGEVMFDGSNRDVPPVFYFCGGTINVKKNAGLTLKTIKLASREVAASSNHASVLAGGLSNIGRLTLDNCTMLVGSYTVKNLTGGQLKLTGSTIVEGSDNLVNSGNAYIEGSVSIAGIQNKKDGRIYISSALTNDINITIEEEDIELDVPVIHGCDGYQLTISDANHIHLTLPAGYEAKFNIQEASISIISTSAISGIANELPTITETFDITGHRIKSKGTGVAIQRMSNGMIRKTINK